MIRRFLLPAAMLSLSLGVSAQSWTALQSAAGQAGDLQFPAEPSTLSVFSGPKMALYKPDGPGPFPALVLMHQCGGLYNERWQNMSMVEWTKQAVAHGYVALLVDSLHPRGAANVCMGVQGGVNFARGVRDALQAADHLRKFDFVDKDRVAVAGYSWGAMVSVLASRKSWGQALAPGERFKAAVAFYPGCMTIRPQRGPAYEIVDTDIDRPLLVLMGERDTETPPSECMPKLDAARAAGAPVQTHVYPEATHCWDCRNLDYFSKTDIRGTHVVYRYNEAATADASQRMFDFLEQALRRKQ